jgi:hypothetical protein
MDYNKGEIKMNGLYRKYNVEKNGKETDPEADYFVLRLDSDDNARQALLLYAQLIEDTNKLLAKEIRQKIAKYDEDCSLHLPVAYNTRQESFIVASEIQYDSYGNFTKVIGIDENGELAEHNRQNVDLTYDEWY